MTNIKVEVDLLNSTNNIISANNKNSALISAIEANANSLFDNYWHGIKSDVYKAQCVANIKDLKATSNESDSEAITTADSINMMNEQEIKTGSEYSNKINIVSYNQKEYSNYYYSKDPVNNNQFNGATISSHGCAPTCLAMAYASLTGYEDPDKTLPVEITKQMLSNKNEDNYRIPLGGEHGTYWDGAVDGVAIEAEKLGLNVERICERGKKLTDDEKNTIIEALKSDDKLVIALEGDSGLGDKAIFKTSGHYVLLSDIDISGNVKVNDPYNNEHTGLINFENIAAENKGAYWILSKKDIEMLDFGL